MNLQNLVRSCKSIISDGTKEQPVEGSETATGDAERDKRAVIMDAPETRARALLAALKDDPTSIKTV